MCCYYSVAEKVWGGGVVGGKWRSGFDLNQTTEEVEISADVTAQKNDVESVVVEGNDGDGDGDSGSWI